MDEVEATTEVMLAKYKDIVMTADTKTEDRTGKVTTQIIQVKVSVDGRSGTNSTQGQQIMCELIGESNEIMIEIQSEKINALYMFGDY